MMDNIRFRPYEMKKIDMLPSSFPIGFKYTRVEDNTHICGLGIPLFNKEQFLAGRTWKVSILGKSFKPIVRVKMGRAVT